MVSRVLDSFVKAVLEYDTPKIVHIRSKKVGLMNRFLQCAIITYVIVYVMILQKGYQEFSIINSSITTKVKGIVVTNFTKDNEFGIDPHVYNRVWDVADFVIPPQENGAFFVLTNAIITPNQTMDNCAESPLISGAKCNDSQDCADFVGQSLPNGNGIVTGECIQYDKVDKTCEIYGWCPVEKDDVPLKDRPLLEGTENFTVLIKNSVEFPLWNVKTRNIADSSNKSYLSGCRYDASENAACPIFELGTIVNLAQEKMNLTYTQLATSGGVISIFIHWECNFDFDWRTCLPTYDFRRSDDPEAKLANGWNFRFAKFFDNDQRRTLYKAYGILFVVVVQGRGGKFSTVPFLMNLGSGIALLSITVIICDIIVLYVLQKRDYYQEKKYLVVDDVDGDTDKLFEEPLED